MRLDQRRVDHGNDMTGIGQILGNGLPVNAGGLHADMQRVVDLLLGQPGLQLGKTGSGVVDHLAAIFAITQQGTIEFGLGDINAKPEGERSWVHTLALSTL